MPQTNISKTEIDKNISNKNCRIWKKYKNISLKRKEICSCSLQIHIFLKKQLRFSLHQLILFIILYKVLK